MSSETPFPLERLLRLAADTVGGAQRRLPPEIRPLARNVTVHYERLPGDDVLREGFPDDILGFFKGRAHDAEIASNDPEPPQIMLFLENLWDFAEGDEDVFREEVEVTYLHELGHYFGWDEDDVASRGLD